jgi:hypothetical protein
MMMMPRFMGANPSFRSAPPLASRWSEGVAWLLLRVQRHPWLSLLALGLGVYAVVSLLTPSKWAPPVNPKFQSLFPPALLQPLEAMGYRAPLSHLQQSWLTLRLVQWQGLLQGQQYGALWQQWADPLLQRQPQAQAQWFKLTHCMEAHLGPLQALETRAVLWLKEPVPPHRLGMVVAAEHAKAMAFYLWWVDNDEGQTPVRTVVPHTWSAWFVATQQPDFLPCLQG